MTRVAPQNTKKAQKARKGQTAQRAPKGQKAQKETSRIRILRSAAQLFQQQGYDAVTVDQICQEAQAAKGSFYHFFDSKEELAIQLLDDLWSARESSLESIFSDERPPLEQIRDELYRIYSESRQSRERNGEIGGCPIGFLSMNLCTRSVRLRKRAIFLYNHIRQFYVGAFTKAQDRGDIADVRDPGEMADAMLSMVQGIHLLSRTYNSPAKLKRSVNAAFAVLTDG